MTPHRKYMRPPDRELAIVRRLINNIRATPPDELREAMHRLREGIREIEEFIAWCERAMRAGTPPCDIEPVRVQLHEMRQWEWLLQRVGGAACD